MTRLTKKERDEIVSAVLVYTDYRIPETKRAMVDRLQGVVDKLVKSERRRAVRVLRRKARERSMPYGSVATLVLNEAADEIWRGGAR